MLAEHGIEPLELAPKEGLSLVNGTEPMQALLAFSVHDAELLVKAADVACALSVEALLGTDRPYDERVQVIRPHPGPAGQRGQPARPAGRLGADGQSPAQHAMRCRTPTACAAPRRCTVRSAMCSAMPGG